MTRTVPDTYHGPQTVLSCFRPRSEVIPVRIRGFRRPSAERMVSGRLEAVQAATAAFSEEWPLAAVTVRSVDIVSQVTVRRGDSPDQLAGAFTGLKLGRVFSKVQLSLSSFLDPDLDVQFQAWRARGDIVSSCLGGVIWHEFGHVLLNTLVMRAEPLSRSAEAGARLVVSRALGSSTKTSAVLAGSKLSKRAQISYEELVAEGVADFGMMGHHAHPVSVAVVMVLAELWHS